MNQFDQVEAAKNFIEARIPRGPTVGCILGSGLGAFAGEVRNRIEIPYGDIPNWPKSTAIGHAGKLVLGQVDGTIVAVMAGRVHFYEGYSMQQVTFPVRVLGSLGVKSLLLTNAAGGIHPGLKQGCLVLLCDHLNLQGNHPLMGPNDDRWGPRFPDMSEAYDRKFRELAHQAAREIGSELYEGVYAALSGPSYETPAEIRYLRTIGADLVGMSTVPEVIVANHMGIRCLAISCVTNLAAGISPTKLSHHEVMETGERVRGELTQLLRKLLPRMAQTQDGH
jgi:purine-nucleoside phosphorylase